MSVSVLNTVKCGKSLTAAIIRQKHTLITGEGRLSVEAVVKQQQQPHQQMHQVVTSVQPTVPLPPSMVLMPPNVKELEASEKAQFSPWRTRDTSSAHIAAYGGSLFGSGLGKNAGLREGDYNFGSVPTDHHVGVYDCSDTVSLDSSIGTNVPKPYGLSGQVPSHFSSPDSHRGQDDKYVAGELQDHHQSTHRSSKKTTGTALAPFGSSGVRRGMWGGVTDLPNRAGHSIRQYGTLCYGGRLVVAGTHPVLNCPNLVLLWPNNSISGSGGLCGSDFVRIQRCIHTCMTAKVQEKKSESGDAGTPESALTSGQKLKRAVKEYGSTVIVFHVAISLTSLGICYLLVSSGVDMTSLIKTLGINLGTSGDGAAEQLGSPQVGEADGGEADVDTNTRRAAGAATFVVAYAVHKVFAPVRIATTLTATPFIVRYLRRKGFLKLPKVKS